MYNIMCPHSIYGKRGLILNQQHNATGCTQLYTHQCIMAQLIPPSLCAYVAIVKSAYLGDSNTFRCVSIPLSVREQCSKRGAVPSKGDGQQGQQCGGLTGCVMRHQGVRVILGGCRGRASPC
uniref:Uncharacterized protein n=1 Tax=Eutreptiella gymnastica TaxID=73025 RepID=A0A7S4FDQ1_9EUGL